MIFDSKSFKSLEEVLKHFDSSNMISVEDIFNTCKKASEKTTEQVQKFMQNSFEATVTENEYTKSYSYDLPGVAKEDIEITIADSKLTVKVSKQKGKVVNFKSEVTLPKTLDPSRVNTKLDLGVLEVIITKSEALKPRTIKIN